ncbi:MAG TPA: helicase HerA-like domain-containing protein [Thermoleophilia bacterium]|nr:helicase HerA-like domain-containing protein [Thermoleophilia bacterium]
MTEGLPIAKGTAGLRLLPHMAGRHGPVAVATGTSKTVTPQMLAEASGSLDVPVVVTDTVKYVTDDDAGIDTTYGNVSTTSIAAIQQLLRGPPAPYSRDGRRTRGATRQDHRAAGTHARAVPMPVFVTP